MALSSEARVILAHQRMLDEVRRRVVDYTQHEWAGLGSWHGADVDRFLARVLPVVETGQKQTYQLTTSYLDSIARLQGLEPVAPTKLPRLLAGQTKESPRAYWFRRGVTREEVYRRPFEQAWWRLSEGDSLDSAVNAGADRLDQLAQMDMQMSNVQSAFDKLSGDKNVVGYMRILGGGESCALCAIASTQRYHTEDLMEIHDRCDCTVEPIYGDEDPGQVINEDRLQGMQDVLEQAGVKYEGGEFKTDRSIRVQFHGETGPTLTWADQNFLSAADIRQRGYKILGASEEVANP